MIPFVAARVSGNGPSGVPKVRTWSRLKSHVAPLASAYSTAWANFAESIPTAAADFICHEPGGGKYVDARLAWPLIEASGRATAINSLANARIVRVSGVGLPS